MLCMHGMEGLGASPGEYPEAELEWKRFISRHFMKGKGRRVWTEQRWPQTVVQPSRSWPTHGELRGRTRLLVGPCSGGHKWPGLALSLAFLLDGEVKRTLLIFKVIVFTAVCILKLALMNVELSEKTNSHLSSEI